MDFCICAASTKVCETRTTQNPIPAIKRRRKCLGCGNTQWSFEINENNWHKLTGLHKTLVKDKSKSSPCTCSGHTRVCETRMTSGPIPAIKRRRECLVCGTKQWSFEILHTNWCMLTGTQMVIRTNTAKKTIAAQEDSNLLFKAWNSYRG